MIRGRWTVGGPYPPPPPTFARWRPEEEEEEEDEDNMSYRVSYYFHWSYLITSTTFIIYIPIFAPYRWSRNCTVSRTLVLR